MSDRCIFNIFYFYRRKHISRTKCIYPLMLKSDPGPYYSHKHFGIKSLPQLMLKEKRDLHWSNPRCILVCLMLTRGTPLYPRPTHHQFSPKFRPNRLVFFQEDLEICLHYCKKILSVKLDCEPNGCEG